MMEGKGWFMTNGGILEDGSPEALVRAVEANLASTMGLFGLSEKVEMHREPHMQWHMTDVPFPLFNGVLGLRLAEEDAEAAIASLLVRARVRHVPFMAWVGPSDRPLDLSARLTRSGFVQTPPSPGMVLDLAELGPEPPAPEGFTIEAVTDGAALERWAHACVEGFEMPAFVEAPLLETLRAIDQTPDAPMRHYLGLLDGAPAAAATVSFGAGVAGVYNVATVPSARRRGIGRAITHRALEEGRRAGYRYAVLQASPEGAPLYREMGFREVCTIDTYLWMPDGGGGIR